ncbi:MAG TPA: hypothetical protein VK539_17140 [Myxococcaceae bacterium]|nr:hypothetical protein [Myxococcaceae bacterium]
METPIDVALRVARAFDDLGLGYFLGGSFASSIQGEPRATNDIDFVVDLALAKVEPLVERLGPDFDVDAESLEEAVRLRRSWNIYYLPTAVKIDLFILQDSPFDRSEFSRRRPIEVRSGEAIVVKSAEDTVLRKLLWFVAGGGVSDRQWRDIVQVLRVSGPVINVDYLVHWAGQLGVSELLVRARDEAGRLSGR